LPAQATIGVLYQITTDMFDSVLQGMVIMLLVILLLGLLLKKLNQPYFIAYIIAGILLGPRSLNIVGMRTL
jgi:CPA2 family monovalent cation:H+ antiporter-2